MLPLRELLTIALFVGVTARVAWRFRHATPLAQRALGPVLVGLDLPARRLLQRGRRAPDRARVGGGERRDVAAGARGPAPGPRLPRRRLALAPVHRRRRCSGSPCGCRAGCGPTSSQAALAEEFQDRSLAIVRRVDDDPGRWVDVAGARGARAGGDELARADRRLRRQRPRRGDRSTTRRSATTPRSTRPRRRYVLIALHQAAARRGDRAARARGPRGARPRRVRGRDRAQAHRGRPARRRPAAPGRARDPARAGGGARRRRSTRPPRRSCARSASRSTGARGGVARWPATAARRC